MSLLKKENILLSKTGIDYNKLDELFELAKILSSQTDFQESLRIVSLKASSMFDADVVTILMVNPQTQNTIKTILKEGKDVDQNKYSFERTNVIGLAASTNKPFLSSNIKKDSCFKKGVFKKSGIQSVMCFPFQSEGIVTGYILLMNTQGSKLFDSEEFSLLEKFAIIVAPALSNVQKIKDYFLTVLPDESLLTKYESLGLIGKSRQFLELLKTIEAAARCDVRVLLEGQSGTGKELIARAIHQNSSRKDRPFVALDCGAIPENLIESELFGHVKGAFTGATTNRKGLIEEAHGGTLFMDEITNLPFSMQSKLLRVLQEGEIRVLGSNTLRRVDVRIISAASTSLRKLVDSQQFREDLYYRLHVYPIRVPTLNERQDDIPILAHYFLHKFARTQNKKANTFHGSIINFMKQRKWNGNIRELENFIERLVTCTDQEKTNIDLKILPPEFKKEHAKLSKNFEEHTIKKSLHESLNEYEEKLLRQALIENDWNQSKTARVLKISERNVRFKMDKFGIVKPK